MARKLRWSKRNDMYPKPGEVWITHLDECLWLILETMRYGWSSWKFDALNLETGERDILHANKSWIPRWKKQS